MFSRSGESQKLGKIRLYRSEAPKCPDFLLCFIFVAPIWDELGDKYESNPDIAIAKIDITANDVVIGGYQVTASPSIYFYSVSDKGNPSLYDGQLELDEFVSYLEKHNVRDEL